MDRMAFPAGGHTRSIGMSCHDDTRLARPVVTDLIEVAYPTQPR
jgi:hypothetical protein